MEMQPQISQEHRLTLVDWLMEVHTHCRFCLETLHPTVAIIGHHLMSEIVMLNQLQLVGLTSPLIASKCKEVGHANADKLIISAGNPFDDSVLLAMETQILKSLNCQIKMPLGHTFPVRFKRAAHADKKIAHAACHSLEGTLLSCDPQRKCKPSELAAALTFFARHYSVGHAPWSQTLAKCTGHTNEDVVPVAPAILKAKSRWASAKAKSAGSQDANVHVNKKCSVCFGGVALIDFQLDFRASHLTVLHLIRPCTANLAWRTMEGGET